MLLVPTKLGPSSIHGIGIFAAAPIAKGTVVWKLNPVIDVCLSEPAIQDLSEPARKQVKSYVYLDNRTGERILCGDDARFFNHAENPNVVDDPIDPYQCVASRQIAVGEELTHDYFSFDALASDKLSNTVSNEL